MTHSNLLFSWSRSFFYVLALASSMVGCSSSEADDTGSGTQDLLGLFEPPLPTWAADLEAGGKWTLSDHSKKQPFNFYNTMAFKVDSGGKKVMATVTYRQTHEDRDPTEETKQVTFLVSKKDCL